MTGASSQNPNVPNTIQSFSLLLKTCLAAPTGWQFLTEISKDLVPTAPKDTRAKDALHLVHALKQVYGHPPTWEEIRVKADLPDMTVAADMSPGRAFRDHVLAVFLRDSQKHLRAIGDAAHVGDVLAIRETLKAMDVIVRHAERKTLDVFDMTSADDVTGLAQNGADFTVDQQRIVTVPHLPSLDGMLYLNAGDLHAVVGRPGSGKTTQTVTWATRLAEAANHVLYVSPEMGRGVIYANAFSANKNRGTFRVLGSTTTEVREHVIANIDEYTLDFHGGGSFRVVSTDGKKAASSMKIADLRAYIETYRPTVLFIDSAYMLEPEGTGYGAKKGYELMGLRISQYHDLAREYGITVIIVWQANRESMEAVKRAAKSVKSGKQASRVDTASEAGGVYGGDALLQHCASLAMLTAIAPGVNRLVMAKNRFAPEGSEHYYTVVMTEGGRFVEEIEREDVALASPEQTSYTA